jgi:hypothetical protein
MGAVSEGRALAFTDRIATVCSQRLGGTLTSMIVHGSLVLDDFTPPASDIDLLAIVERPLRDAEAESLVRGVTAGDREAPAPVDLRVVTRAAAARPSPAPPLELALRFGGGKRPAIERRNPSEPDVAVELSICRERGRTIRGDEPRVAIGEVPKRLVLIAGDRQLSRWQSLTHDAAHAALMVLTACRIWRFGVDGRHHSKGAAGSWALSRDPSLAAVRDALRQRAGCRVRIEPSEIGRLLRIVRARIAVGVAWEAQSRCGE